MDGAVDGAVPGKAPSTGMQHLCCYTATAARGGVLAQGWELVRALPQLVTSC